MQKFKDAHAWEPEKGRDLKYGGRKGAMHACRANLGELGKGNWEGTSQG